MRKEICFRFSNNSYCWKKESCEFVHKKKSDEVDTEREEKEDEREKEKVFLDEKNTEKRLENIEKTMMLMLKKMGITSKETE